MNLEPAACYRALRARDARFDGRFFVAVHSTGIYCRPICPARTPKRENVTFVASAAAAEAEGFRACLRCRPDSVLEAAEWSRGPAVVARALRWIDDGFEGGVDALSERVGVGARHLGRLFRRHVGATPIQVAQTRRAHFARKLLDETDLPMTSVALAAGFASVRRFNALMKQRFGRPPRELRGSRQTDDASVVELRLPYHAPFAYPALLAFLGPRAIPGVERVIDGAYHRTVSAGGGTLSVSHDDRANELCVACRGVLVAELQGVVQRVRDLFDLRHDPSPMLDALGADPQLSDALRASPGLRVPGAFDGFELAVRAVLGQQVSVAGATTLSGRLVDRYGVAIDGLPGLDRLFPTAAHLADASLADVGLTRTRAEAVRSLARAVVDGDVDLSPGSDPAEGGVALRSLPGIGDWTAEYIAMRVFRDPDAFPSGDLALRKAASDGPPLSASALKRVAERWRPWRAYAAIALWSRLTAAKPTIHDELDSEPHVPRKTTRAAGLSSRKRRGGRLR